MTFSLRRKLPTILRAARRKAAAATITSMLFFVGVSGAFAQNTVTPRFVATPQQRAPQPGQQSAPPIVTIDYRTTNANQPVPALPAMQGIKPTDDRMEGYIRTELPGPQRLFMRDSEQAFLERIAQEAKKTPGSQRAIFPESPIISKEKHQPRRWDGMPVVTVEPGYVCHRRLLFEQPAFERTGYNFGILQPAIGVGLFYYDLALMPYHAFSDLHNLGECSAGKCLPGDPAPLYLRRERFSVTGLVAEGASVVGLLYLFPPPIAP